jgi:hypothetical protein
VVAKGSIERCPRASDKLCERQIHLVRYSNSYFRDHSYMAGSKHAGTRKALTCEQVATPYGLKHCAASAAPPGDPSP